MDANMEVDDAGLQNEFEALMSTGIVDDAEEFSEEPTPKVVVRESKEPKELTVDADQKLQLYKSLDVPTDESGIKFGPWRLEAVHVRGVHDMSSEDVLDYFSDFNPNSLEWVNDLSCNIVFDSQDVAACVLRDLTTALVVKGKRYKEVDKCDVEVIDGDTLDVAVPPGRWRMGKKHEKAKTLLLRFATTGDKKVKGARKYSQYYQKHGFPVRKQESTGSDSEVKEFRRRINVDENEGKSTKLLKMRMRADDEEELQNKFRAKSRLHVQVDPDSATRVVTDEPGSIWDRLDSGAFPRSNLSHGARTVTANIPFGRSSVWERLQLKQRPSEENHLQDLRSKINQRRERRSRISDPY